MGEWYDGCCQSRLLHGCYIACVVGAGRVTRCFMLMWVDHILRSVCGLCFILLSLSHFLVVF